MATSKKASTHPKQPGFFNILTSASTKPLHLHLFIDTRMPRSPALVPTTSAISDLQAASCKLQGSWQLGKADQHNINPMVLRGNGMINTVGHRHNKTARQHRIILYSL